uniref:Uncharacterized protein n=1 Tax=Plectus sambesii TaxID=2011161 RepID=A0A914VR22_9BILA
MMGHSFVDGTQRRDSENKARIRRRRPVVGKPVGLLCDKVVRSWTRTRAQAGANSSGAREERGGSTWWRVGGTLGVAGRTAVGYLPTRLDADELKRERLECGTATAAIGRELMRFAAAPSPSTAPRRRPSTGAAANGGGANERDRDGDFARRRVSKSPVDPPTVASVDCSRSTGNARRQIRRTPLVAISTCAFHFDACSTYHRHRASGWVYGALLLVLFAAKTTKRRDCKRRSAVAVNPIAHVLCVADRWPESWKGLSQFLQSARISRAISASADCDRPAGPPTDPNGNCD